MRNCLSLSIEEDDARIRKASEKAVNAFTEQLDPWRLSGPTALLRAGSATARC